MNVILKDSFYGAILLGGISYLNQIYKNNPQYSKISGFLIGAPTGFFLGLNKFTGVFPIKCHPPGLILG